MKKTSLFLLLALFVLGGCTGSKKAATDMMDSTADAAAEMAEPMVQNEMHPLVGAWDYSVDTPQGVYTGILTIMDSADGLMGKIAQSEQPDLAAPVDELMFDGDNSSTTFTFDSGEFGIMKVKLKLAGDAMDGVMTVTSYGVDVPMTAKRIVE